MRLVVTPRRDEEPGFGSGGQMRLAMQTWNPPPDHSTFYNGMQRESNRRKSLLQKDSTTRILMWPASRRLTLTPLTDSQYGATKPSGWTEKEDIKEEYLSWLRTTSQQ